MSELRLYNTLSRQVEPFTPVVPGEVKVYVCGPTVYDVAHAGNARPPVVFDVLVRHLRARGLRVTYVRNITDVDDKIVDRARENGEAPLALSARMAPVFQADMRALGCADPTHEPKVSETIPEIVALVEKLVARGHAYPVKMPSGGTDVYFAVRSFDGYGKLSRRNVDELEVGARVERDDAKKDPLDFALWKGCASDDAFGWDSPWGKGRPGWHIECSAMAAKFLGHGFDIHGGGMDLVFPHHENEIAQSEAAEGTAPFARTWMHNGFINVDKEKMSKSLGNFVRPCDVYANNDPEGLRWFYLTAQYRGPLTFDVEKTEGGRVVYPGVDEAERRIDYLYATWERLAAVARPGVVDPKRNELWTMKKLVGEARGKVAAALDDDLNTPVALAAVIELAKVGNDLCDMLQKRRKDAQLVESGAALAAETLAALRACTDVLGLLQSTPEAYAARTRERRLRSRGLDAGAIDAKIAERAAARAAKDWARSDALRDELAALGVDLADGPQGTTWTVRV